MFDTTTPSGTTQSSKDLNSKRLFQVTLCAATQLVPVDIGMTGTRAARRQFCAVDAT